MLARTKGRGRETVTLTPGPSPGGRGVPASRQGGSRDVRIACPMRSRTAAVGSRIRPFSKRSTVSPAAASQWSRVRSRSVAESGRRHRLRRQDARPRRRSRRRKGPAAAACETSRPPACVRPAIARAPGLPESPPGRSARARYVSGRNRCGTERVDLKTRELRVASFDRHPSPSGRGAGGEGKSSCYLRSLARDRPPPIQCKG